MVSIAFIGPASGLGITVRFYSAGTLAGSTTLSNLPAGTRAYTGSWAAPAAATAYAVEFADTTTGEQYGTGELRTDAAGNETTSEDTGGTGIS